MNGPASRNSLLIRASSLIAVGFLFVLTGCERLVSSGIPKTLNSETQLKFAGAPQGVSLSGSSYGEAWDTRSAQCERRFDATISSGTSGQLLAAYRKEVERTITNMGGAIHGTGVSGGTNDVKDFSFDYTWGGNDGIVRAYSFTDTSGQVQVVMFCYEHRK